MDKRGLNILITTVILIIFAVALGIGFFYWSTTYTRDITDDATQDRDDTEDVENTKIFIKNVQETRFPSELLLTLENRGRLTLERARVRVTMNDGDVHNDLFPKDVEYEEGLMGLEFLQVRELTIFFDGVSDLRDFSKVEVIPTFRLEDGNLRQVESAIKKYEK